MRTLILPDFTHYEGTAKVLNSDSRQIWPNSTFSNCENNQFFGYQLYNSGRIRSRNPAKWSSWLISYGHFSPIQRFRTTSVYSNSQWWSNPKLISLKKIENQLTLYAYVKYFEFTRPSVLRYRPLRTPPPAQPKPKIKWKKKLFKK